MRYLELCFHEQDARLADLASRGLEAAGACVLRRGISAKHRPGISAATRHRVILHSPALVAVEENLPGLSGPTVSPAVAIPTGSAWPQRRSRPWLLVPPGAAAFEAQAFWTVISRAAQQPLETTSQRLAAQRELMRSLLALRSRPLGRMRRRRPLSLHLDLQPLKPVRSLRDWQSAVTPMAVAGVLAGAALFSAFTVGAAARPEAWSAIAQETVENPAAGAHIN